MLRNYLLPIVIVLLSALPVEAAGPLETAGRVDFVTGDAWLIDASQQIRRAVRGDRLRATDSVITARDGEVHLDMEDGGYLAVRPNSLLKVEDYRAHGDKDDRVVIRLLKGTFRSFTGWVPKVTLDGYRTRTITATIGVRGTDHEPLFIPEGSDIGEPGTYDKVNEGATFIDHASGRIEVLPNTAGFAPLSAGAKARLLERVPDFFRPSPNENLLTGRHKLVQDRLQERLDARRRLKNPQTQEGEPQTESPSEMQEAPAEPNGTRGIQDAPASSTVPSIPVAPATAVLPGAPVAPASAVVPSIPAASPAAVVPSIPSPSAVVPSATAAPASALVPSASAAPASVIVPSASTAPASAVVPSARAAPASSAVPTSPAASPTAVMPNTSGRPRSAAGRPRGVPEGGQSPVDGAPPKAAQPAANEREKVYNERRKKQQRIIRINTSVTARSNANAILTASATPIARQRNGVRNSAERTP
jgi:hypothetical protein